MSRQHDARLKGADLAELNERLEAIPASVHERDDPVTDRRKSPTIVMRPPAVKGQVKNRG